MHDGLYKKTVIHAYVAGRGQAPCTPERSKGVKGLKGNQPGGAEPVDVEVTVAGKAEVAEGTPEAAAAAEAPRAATQHPMGPDFSLFRLTVITPAVSLIGSLIIPVPAPHQYITDCLI